VCTLTRLNSLKEREEEEEGEREREGRIERETEREREKMRKRERERKNWRERVKMCVYERKREQEGERENERKREIGRERETVKEREILDQSVQFIAMGWLQLVGSIKLQVSFAEYSLFYRSLLQKRPVILRSLTIIATSYLGEALSSVLRVCGGYG